MMDEAELRDDEQRVLEAASTIEAEGEAGTLQQIAGRAGLAVSDARAALSSLTGDKGLVQEVGTTQPDLGVRYSVRDHPSPS